jgi:uncharacterized membrane protein YidH (DUF202 family)
MSRTGRLFGHRRAVPVLDVGLQVERTAMAWQRTALALGGVSALLVHLADRRPLAAVPGVAGLLVALALLVVAEHRYERMVRTIEAGGTPLARAVIRLLAAGCVVLSASAVVLLLVTDG